MHIAGGFLSFPIAMLFWIVSFAIIALSYKRLTGKNAFRKERIPLVAAMVFLVFALQMLNFPIVSGTTGHFMGGVLLAFLFGFDIAVISMASILFIQAFVFHDGGVLALGANIFNMGILAPAVGLKIKGLVKNRLAGLFTGSFLGTAAASASCALQIGISGSVPLVPAILAMAYYHSFIGVAEGLIALGLIGLSFSFFPSIYRSGIVQ